MAVLLDEGPDHPVLVPVQLAARTSLVRADVSACGQALAEVGDRMFTDAVFVRNERVARELGAGWAAALMDRCERGLAPPALSRRGQRPCGGRAPTLEGLAVLWCDADPAVTESAGPLRAAGMSVRTFREPEDALEFFRGAPAGAVGAVLTSMMRGGGREARGRCSGSCRCRPTGRRAWRLARTSSCTAIARGRSGGCCRS
ncbi:unnamed protein product [Prorocentrum cordatum]|uniref:Uncharacterized protein n=1 Tax=Prorocentrum cordatum TaxID=2364126 RepID=A0ABN9VFS9_9DINO|nr:unnamed protein product [Polarella glacialis]